MLNLFLFCVKWNLIIVATGDAAPREKNKQTNNKKKQTNNTES